MVVERACGHAYNRDPNLIRLGVDDPDISKIVLSKERESKRNNRLQDAITYVRAHASSSSAASSIRFAVDDGDQKVTFSVDQVCEDTPDEVGTCPLSDDDSGCPPPSESSRVTSRSEQSAYAIRMPGFVIPEHVKFDTAIAAHYVRSMIPDSVYLENDSAERLVSDPVITICFDGEALNAINESRGEYDAFGLAISFTIPYMDYRAVVGALQREHTGTSLFRGCSKTMAPAFRPTTVRFPSFESRFIAVPKSKKSKKSLAVDLSGTDEGGTVRVETMAMLDTFSGFWEECRTFIPAKGLDAIEEAERTPGMIMKYGSTKKILNTSERDGSSVRFKRWASIHGTTLKSIGEILDREKEFSCPWSTLIRTVQGDNYGRTEAGAISTTSLCNALEDVIVCCFRVFSGDRTRLEAIARHAALSTSSGSSIAHISRVVETHSKMPASFECTRENCWACSECAQNGTLFVACLTYFSFLRDVDKTTLILKLERIAVPTLPMPRPPHTRKISRRRGSSKEDEETCIRRSASLTVCHWHNLCTGSVKEITETGSDDIKRMLEMYVDPGVAVRTARIWKAYFSGCLTSFSIGKEYVRRVVELHRESSTTGATPISNRRKRRKTRSGLCPVCVRCAKDGSLFLASIYVFLAARSILHPVGLQLKRFRDPS